MDPAMIFLAEPGLAGLIGRRAKNRVDRTARGLAWSSEVEGFASYRYGQ